LSDAARAAALAARASYGRLLAMLAARSQDIAAAEDALADAFALALARWPATGVPANRDGWLFTVARNRLTDRRRHQTRFPATPDVPDVPDMPAAAEAPFRDQRLALMMVCAHPAIPRDLHTPLMLQTVLGIDARAIALLFLIPPAALSKRLVRAKAKIKAAGIPFRLPDAEELPERTAAIHEAIYAVHAHDWLTPTDGLGDEALYLADLLTRLAPDQPEGVGLAALIAFGHARREARAPDGVLIPPQEQDLMLWDDRLARYGARQLRRAHAMGAPGRFQIEAAIQSVHIDRKRTGRTDWDALDKLYVALVQVAPSAGAIAAQAVVSAQVRGPLAGLDALDALAAETGPGFQPLWAARADLLARAGRGAEAREAYDKAISLTTEAPAARFLKARRDAPPLSAGRRHE
jgi:RNA polymerase sigma-70 factor (ECF subfamily)